MPPIHLLIKPASGLCNLRCKYCFYHDITENRAVSSYGVMSVDTLESVLGKAFAYADDSLTVAFQGGEPTLAGLDFFHACMELQKKHNRKGLKINNAIQTNGYHLTDEWARFFHDNHFLVGLSLDGRRETHDTHRVDASGSGTFGAVMDTARLFDRFEVEYNILTVVNALIARDIRDIYKFYKKQGFRYLQFIPCLDPLGEPFGQNDYSLTPEIYGKFLIALFDLWARDLESVKPVSIREFDNYVQILLGYPPESCGMSGVCSRQNVIEADGSVYPCDFYVLDEYRLGSLLTDDFPAIEEKRKALRFIEQSRPIDIECRTCPYARLCRGGCRRHREPFQNGLPRLNYFCPAYKIFFAHAQDRLAQIARRLRGRGT